MKLLMALFLLANIGNVFASTQPVMLDVWKIPSIEASSACKVVARSEPKSQLSFKFNGTDYHIPIYSDLCDAMTQQFVVAIYRRLSERADEPIIGLQYENDGSVIFSNFVLRH